MVARLQGRVLCVGLSESIGLRSRVQMLGDDRSWSRDGAVSELRLHEVASNEVGPVVSWFRAFTCWRERDGRVLSQQGLVDVLQKPPYCRRDA